ncbi:hypothetical protein MMC11_007369 [Xylographa trunciseda]|nr:hypothetical protein [Xylographa trunciseda]
MAATYNCGLDQDDIPLLEHDSLVSSVELAGLAMEQGSLALSSFGGSRTPEESSDKSGESSEIEANVRDALHCNWQFTSEQRIAGAFSLGILLVVCHHSFYQLLDGQTPWTGSTQEWPMRIGVSFSILTRLFLAMAVGEAYTQCVWTSLRKEFYTIARIDGLLQATNSLFLLLKLIFSFDSRMKLVFAILLALVVWGLNIATPFTSATLSLGMRQPYNSIRSVPQLNFTNYYAFSEDPFPLNPPYPPNSEIFTSKNPGTVPEVALFMHSYDQSDCIGSPHSFDSRCVPRIRPPSPELQTLTHAVVINRQTITEPMIWASESHLSYSLKFNGPSLSCDSIDANVLTPNGTSIAEILQFAPWRLNHGFGMTSSVPFKLANPVPEALLALSQRIFAAMAPDDLSPLYWSFPRKISNLYNSPYQLWISVYGSDHSHQAYVCKLYNASYTAYFTKNGPVTSVQVIELTNINEVVQHNVTWTGGQGLNVTWGTGGPHTNPLIPQTNIELSYVAILQAFSDCIIGTLPSRIPIFNKRALNAEDVLRAPLMDSAEFATRSWNPWLTTSGGSFGRLSDSRNLSVVEILEEQFKNVTLSLFALQSLSSGAISFNLTPPINITINDNPATYHYNAHGFWLANGLSIAFTVFAISIGHVSLRANGRGSFFSVNLSTTRNNPRLDRQPGIEGLGEEVLSDEMKRTELKFEQLDQQWRDRNFGFGSRSQIYGLRSGEYLGARLSRRRSRWWDFSL